MSMRGVLLGTLVAASAVAGFLLYQQGRGPVADGQAAFEAELDRPRTPLADPAMVGKQRPGFTLPDMAGNPREIGEWDGRVLAINFWASWCLPCLKEIPELVELQARYEASGLQVIGIALQDPEELEQFIVEKKMNYPVLAGEGPVIAVAENYGNLAGVLPYTAIIDRSGKIVFVKAGPVTGKEVEAIITPLL